MRKINYKSDFDFILRLKACSIDADSGPIDVGWPSYEWTARFSTSSKANAYVVSHIGGECTNCFNDNGEIHVVFNAHRLAPGPLTVEFSAQLPNDLYPDGHRLEVSPQPLDIELDKGPGDSCTIADVELMLPYIRVKYSDLTEEEKAELQSPATEAAKLAEAGELRRMANEQYRYTNEEARKTAEALRQTNECMRENTVTQWQGAEDGRKLAEQKRETAEKNRQTQEGRRVMEEEYRERAENERKENEVTRKTNEEWRKDRFAELAGEMASASVLIETWKGYINQWSSDENTAKSNETARRKAEGERKSAEKARVSAETEREEAETARAEAETVRATEFAGFEGEIEAAKYKVFVDLYNRAFTVNGNVYGKYDPDNAPDVQHPFKAYDLWLTYMEAVDVYNAGRPYNSNDTSSFYTLKTIRTNLPLIISPLSGFGNFMSINNTIEVCRLSLGDNNISQFYAFNQCKKLHTILGKIIAEVDRVFGECPKLANVQVVIKDGVTLHLEQCKSLTLQSVKYMADNSKSCGIVCHPNVYAKLTGDTTNEAAAALTADELAQWQAVLTAAAAKKISFATI